MKTLVIVENFFGRVTDKFCILGKKYTWDRENLSLVVDVCFSLTNYHISLKPLRAEDRYFYSSILGDYQVRAQELQRRNDRRKHYLEIYNKISSETDSDYDSDDDIDNDIDDDNDDNKSEDLLLNSVV